MAGCQAHFNNKERRKTADGALALFNNTTGTINTAIGFEALYANTTGSNNIGLGFQAGDNLTTGNSNIDIGNAGVAGESNTIRIGQPGTQSATYIAGISGTALRAGTDLLFDAT